MERFDRFEKSALVLVHGGCVFLRTAETGDDAYEGVFLEDERGVVVFRIKRGRREVHVSFTRGSYRRAEGKVERSATGEDAFSSEDRLDAILARVILLDQISRNVFRGTEKAFVGDECALRYSKFIVRERLGDDLPPAALGFIVSPFLHSELVEDHVLAEKFCRRMIEKNGANTPLEWTLKYILGHKEVLEMFGRYPHRNEILGRETTVEEAQWLVSAPKFPRGPRVSSGRNSTIRIFKSLVERAACKIFVNRDDNTHRIRTLYKIQVFPSRSIKSHLFYSSPSLSLSTPWPTTRSRPQPWPMESQPTRSYPSCLSSARVCVAVGKTVLFCVTRICTDTQTER